MEMNGSKQWSHGMTAGYPHTSHQPPHRGGRRLYRILTFLAEDKLSTIAIVKCWNNLICIKIYIKPFNFETSEKTILILVKTYCSCKFSSC